MITVHHLNESRSQRILWLLEELQVPYEIKWYWRDARRQAPAELKAIHPLGKSPVITDDGRVVAESGAIVDYLIRRHGRGQFQPAPETSEYDDYIQWMHYAEASAVLPLLLKINLAALGASGIPVLPRIEAEISNQFGYIDQHLAKHDYIMGRALSGADFQLSFVGELAAARIDCSAYPNMITWIRRFQSRPAYRAALDRGGPYALVLS